MPLTGTYDRAIDQKQRIALPKKFRLVWEQPNKRTLYVAPGTDGSLVIFSEESFSRLAERLAALSPTRQDVRAFRRMFYAQAEQVEVDNQGRIRIPGRLANLAGLEREAVLLGVDDHAELWNPDRWQAYYSERAGRYDEIAEAAFRDTEN